MLKVATGHLMVDNPLVGRTLGEKTTKCLLNCGATKDLGDRHIVVFAVLRHHVECGS